jgi:hypothetical protein
MTRRRRGYDPESQLIRARGLSIGDVIITETERGREHRLPVVDIERRTQGWPEGYAGIFVKVEGGREDRLFYSSMSPVRIER